jgi:2'-5' RNA ligase
MSRLGRGYSSDPGFSFGDLRWLGNHWARPAGRRSYYWYLTFANSPQLRSVARQCQDAIRFPYYDQVPAGALHLTLERISFESDITADGLRSVTAAAVHACCDTPPFEITLGCLGGTRGAIGFSAFPSQPIRVLRETLRAATLSVYPDAPVGKSEFHPHVAIAYCNSDNIPAADAIAAVERVRTTARVTVTVEEAAVVLLERQSHSYAWQPISRVRLSG